MPGFLAVTIHRVLPCLLSFFGPNLLFFSSPKWDPINIPMFSWTSLLKFKWMWYMRDCWKCLALTSLWYFECVVPFKSALLANMILFMQTCIWHVAVRLRSWHLLLGWWWHLNIATWMLCSGTAIGRFFMTQWSLPTEHVNSSCLLVREKES